MGSGLADCGLGLTLRDDLDQECPANAAEMTGVIFGLQPEFMDADTLRGRDVDLEVIVFAAVGLSDHNSLGSYHLDDRVVMVRADQGRVRERRLDVIDIRLNALVLLDPGELRRRHGSADGQRGLEHEGIVVRPQEHRLDAGGINLRGEGEQPTRDAIDGRLRSMCGTQDRRHSMIE